MNPFKIDGIVEGVDFMPRPEARELLKYHQAGRNVLVRGPRRMGKSSLVVNTFNKKTYLFIRVDFWGVKTEAKAIEKIARALSEHSKILPTLSGFSVAGVGLQWQSPNARSGVEDLIRLIPKLSKKKPIVVFLDEFQALLDLPEAEQFLGALRSEIQAQPELQYIFAGSHQNQLVEMFYAQRSPFFKSAALMEIGILDRVKFVKWLENKFAGSGRSLIPELWDAIFDFTHSVPGDVQDVCYHLWNDSSKGRTITAEQFGVTLQRVIHERATGYLGMWGMLTGNQQKLAQGISRYGGTQYLSQEFMQASGANSSASIKRGLEALESKGLIWQREDVWIFTDPYFGLWIANAI